MLAVGTFEVRKNYGLLLDVWQRLIDDPQFDLDLVIVGMRGWEADDIIERLEASPLYEQRIFWLRDLGDGAGQKRHPIWMRWHVQPCFRFQYPTRSTAPMIFW